MSKTLLITGANRGIGFEMTKQAAKRGDHVIACARNVMAVSYTHLTLPTMFEV